MWEINFHFQIKAKLLHYITLFFSTTIPIKERLKKDEEEEKKITQTIKNHT